MAFEWQDVSGSTTPALRDSPLVVNNEDSLVSALHAAFRNFGPSASPSSHEPESSMVPTKAHMSLDIIPASQVLSLKGTGANVEPAVLSGHVSLHLTEATSIKEITLQFRGKARLPSDPSDPHVLNNVHNVFVVCQHDWSFLEGKRNHSHTLKPGRHLFPFELRLGGALPSSIATSANGGASVSYKLRATASRPGLAANLTATCPIMITRTISPEGLEYQQTLEIESTWSEKVMYSIMLPHKAWAAGDDVTALIKLVPLVKGVHVLSITTRIHETTKTHCRSGHLENTKATVMKKHDIVDGRAVCDEELHHQPLQHLWRQPYPLDFTSHSLSREHHAPHNLVDAAYSTSIPSSSSATVSDSIPAATSIPSSELSSPRHDVGTTLADSSGPSQRPHEVIAQVVIPLPSWMVPSHSLDPIIVSYRIRWSILIANPDGHTSELRCSLPIHILDHSLLEESTNATRVTRRLLLGGDGTAAATADDIELPSYPAHVRDRIANMHVPESATVRVANPWAHSYVDPVLGLAATGARTPSSGGVSPGVVEANYVATPVDPSTQPGTPLEWINSELLLSPSELPTQEGTVAARTPPASGPSSSRGSHRSSRRSSRASSPERRSGADETHVHAHALEARAPRGLFSATLRPLTGLAHLSGGRAPTPAPVVPPLVVPTADPGTSTSLLRHSLTEVPTYEIASRGFLGGGAPPLDSLRGLPSYEEARSASDSGLAARFSPARQQEPLSAGAV